MLKQASLKCMLNLTHSHLAQVRQGRERVSYPFPEIFFSITIFLTFDIDIVSSSCSTVLLSLQYFFLTFSVSSLSIFAFSLSDFFYWTGEEISSPFFAWLWQQFLWNSMENVNYFHRWNDFETFACQ